MRGTTLKSIVWIQTTTSPYVHTCPFTQQLCFFAYVTREGDRQTHFSLQITDSIVTDYWLGNNNIKTTRNLVHELPQNKRRVQGSTLRTVFFCAWNICLECLVFQKRLYRNENALIFSKKNTRNSQRNLLQNKICSGNHISANKDT
jgi:hypothetical protein